MTVHVVGGLYRELCVRPQWDRVFGSAGRAALAIASMQAPTVLRSYLASSAVSSFAMETVGLPLSIDGPQIEKTPTFRYLYDSAVPAISGLPGTQLEPLRVDASQVLRFGMLECEAVVHADTAVYDPQNVGAPRAFGDNGSTAKRLALVLNSYEAQVMSGLPRGTPVTECADFLGKRDGAEVVVIKRGPAGALVWTRDGVLTVPAFRTQTVWKIGSGDTFAAHFALAWMHEGKGPVEAAATASKATAFYCETRLPATKELLNDFKPQQIRLSSSWAARKSEVYLAGPFFDIPQVWFIEEARARLVELGLKVFSPFHDIGLGAAADVVHLDLDAIQRCDIVFAIADGIDAGTLYEIGYARAINKPVVILSERESNESLKMAEGSGCVVCRDFTTALYNTLWKVATE